MQMVLCNPFCLFAYLVVVFRFFRERIRLEETLLIQFFGDDYISYRQRVPFSGVPFASGVACIEDMDSDGMSELLLPAFANQHDISLPGSVAKAPSVGVVSVDRNGDHVRDRHNRKAS